MGCAKGGDKDMGTEHIPPAEEAAADLGPAAAGIREVPAQEAALACREAELSPELQEGLRLLDNSQGLLRTIFLGLAMQYRSLDLQRCQLLASAEDPEAELCGVQPRAVQIAASLITLCALFGFQKQAQGLARDTAQEGVCPDLTEVKLGSIVILVALIRLFRLTSPEEAAAQNGAAQESAAQAGAKLPEAAAGDAQELENLEELAEPVIE